MKKPSRQRLWQLNKVKQGLCCQCGEKSIYKASNCKQCYSKKLIFNHKWYEKNKEHHNGLMLKWRQKNPDYMKNYYRSHKGKRTIDSPD